MSATTTSLRMLVARADQLRDRIGHLAQLIQQDPVNDPSRQTLLPWSTILEWYQAILEQIQDFSNFLHNPHLLAAPGGQANLFKTTFVQPQTGIASRPEAAATIYHQSDPATRALPQINYTEARKLLYHEYAQELTAIGKDPTLAGFLTDDELSRLIVEDRTDRLPAMYTKAGQEVEIINERLAKGKEIVQAIGGGFDWKMRLGDIYGDDEDGEDEDEDEDGNGDDDDDDDDDIQSIETPPAELLDPIPNIEPSPMEQDNPQQSSTPNSGFSDTFNFSSSANPSPMTAMATPTGNRHAPINLDLSDSEDEAPPTSAALPQTTETATSSPLFGTPDDKEDEDQDMEQVQF